MAKQWADKFYHSKQWKDCRKIVLHRDRYTCSHCYSRATEVHHITELTPQNINDVSVSLNPDNLMSLCHDCHTKVTQGYGDTDYIFDDEGQVIKI